MDRVRKVLVAAVSRLSLVAIFAVAVLVAGVLLIFSPANAGVGPGGEGSGPSANCNGSGIDGCPWTSNGHGWRAIKVDASDAPRGNGYWATANPACKAEGATHVVAYLVFTGEKTQKDAYIYKFPRAWGGYVGYNGTLSIADAEYLYSLVPWSERRHYTFGSDVGWFCWSEYNYDLSPTISVSGSVEAGTTVRPTGSVLNTGTTKTPSSIQWKVTTFYLDSGVTTIPRAAGGNSADQPAAFYNTGAARGVKETTHRTGQTFSRSSAAQSVNIPDQQVDDLDVGTRVCYALSVQPRRHDSNQWRHSAPACAIVAKKPKVQIWGGDVSVGKPFNGAAISTSSSIVTSRTTKTLGNQSRTYGSWVEYGARATGRITGLGAGSAYSGGLLNATTCGVSLLVFSNTNGNSCSRSERLGYYTQTKQIPDVMNAFAINSTTPEYRSLSDASLRRVVKASRSITINGGGISAGEWLVINAAGQTVTINGDITYTDEPLSSLNDIPQLVIIADRINITDRVQQIDAWLVASGQNGIINTCSNVAQLTSKVCDRQLVVNGPIMAKSLQLRRTHGADKANDASVAAEVFNLRPDAYLWSTARAKSANRIQSVYTRELPPRF